MYSLKSRNPNANLTLYKSRVIQMCEQKEPCTKCGKPFDMSFRVQLPDVGRIGENNILSLVDLYEVAGSGNGDRPYT